jgi:uncharacterized protein
MAATEKILQDTNNRQFPLPEGRWQSYQEWHNVVMLHWRVPLHLIAALLPPGLEPDTFEGEAWVSWLGFTVKKMRPRALPSVPYMSTFEEVNLRTYVTQNGQPGIYLLSAEAGKCLTAYLARIITGIPYVMVPIKTKPGLMCIQNTVHHFNARVNYSSSGPVEDKTPLDYWLTERHSLYVQQNKKLFRYDIHHKEWKLNNVIVSAASLKYKIDGLTVGKAMPNKKHFAKKVRVVLWGKKEIKISDMENDKKDIEKYKYHQNLKENEKDRDDLPDKPDNQTTTEERLINPDRGEK